MDIEEVKKRFYFPNTWYRVGIAVSSLFTNVYYYRYGSNKQRIALEKVPLSEGTYNRLMYARTANAQKKVPTIPRIYIKSNGFAKDSSRTISPHTERFWNVKNCFFEDHGIKEEILRTMNGYFADFPPKPVNYEYTIQIICRNMIELSQISECLINYLGEDTSVRIKEFEFLNVARDLQMSFGDLSLTSDVSDIGEDEIRLIEAELPLTVKGYMYTMISKTSIVEQIDAFVNIGTEVPTKFDVDGVVVNV